MKVSPSELKIDRQRQNADDGIQALADSINTVGQLQPVCVVEDGAGYRVIAGRRRVRACELLGVDVRIHICDHLDSTLLQLKAERDENLCRAPLLASDISTLAAEVAKIEKPKATEASKANLKRGDSPSVQLGRSGEGRVDEKIAEAVGVSRGTLHKITTVAKVAEDPAVSPETREVAKQAMKEMDQTGKVDPAYKKVRAQPEFRSPKAPPAPLILPDWKPLFARFAVELKAVLKIRPEAWESVRDDLASLVEEVRP